jgi:hypothetical protein
MFQLYPPSGKPLPKELTSYDFAKMYAVTLMLVDHAGYYFFAEEEFNWLRVIGRLCVPVWFFLIGYARSRDLSPRLWIGALILVGANIVTGQFIFPLNILATMIFIRIILDPVMERAVRDYEILIGIGFIALFMTIPLSSVWEYGSSGLFFAMFGWFMRNRERINYKYKGVVETFVLAFCVAFFGLLQTLIFSFNETQSAVMVLGLIIVCSFLYFFRPETYPRFTGALPYPLVWLIQLFGRRTLEIYVLHLIAFKFVSLMSGDPRFGWFDFSFML